MTYCSLLSVECWIDKRYRDIMIPFMLFDKKYIPIIMQNDLCAVAIFCGLLPAYLPISSMLTSLTSAHSYNYPSFSKSTLKPMHESQLRIWPQGNKTKHTHMYNSWHVASSIMMTSSNGSIFALLALCAGNSPVTGEFPSQRPWTRTFNVFFDLRPNKRLNKQSRRFETPSRPLWRHCNLWNVGAVRNRIISLYRSLMGFSSGISNCFL